MQGRVTRREALVGLAATAAVAAAQGRGGGAMPARPNVVFILCDDLGYGDLESYGSKIHTPNLNRMAAEGVRFTNWDAADPVCSPSRAALLTGRYPARVGVPKVLFPTDKDGLHLDEVTLANVLKAQGYRTMCVGKWHLGRPVEYLPTNRGFDEYFGIPYSNDMTPRVLMHNTEVIEQTADLDTLTERYTAEAVKFVKSAAEEKTPFFLYMPHTFPHVPLGAGARWRGKSGMGLYGDVVQEIDWSVGEVLRTLKEAGVDGETLVMFSSDNGPWWQGSPGKLRGRKNTTYEGGVREPFIARWPGRIPAGRVVDAQTSMMDVFPTVTKLCHGVMPAKPLDGIDVWPLLTGTKKEIAREPLLYFNEWDLQCARWGDWKLHVARFNTAAYVPAPVGGVHNFVLPKPELYDLKHDPDESYDVAPQHPEVVSEMLAKIDAMLETFPQEVRDAWAASKARKTNPMQPGSWPSGKA